MILFVSLTILALGGPLCAQENSPTTDPENTIPKNGLTVFATGTITNDSLYGRAFNRRLSLLGIQYERRLVEKHFFAILYAPQAIPLALLSEPAVEGIALLRSAPPFTSVEYILGSGLNPVSFQTIFRPSARVQPILAGNGGFLFFTKNVPTMLAAQFNFDVSTSGGLRFRLRRQRFLTLGYGFHHFSNGYTARDNPGVDSQIVYASYTFSGGRNH